ncbi:molecular chaperone TorD family protein [Natronoarchaeum sp. GCM10025321]|uniref:molecular chaperone TorD family protein n=1 Tax=Natronoarchaeum sp. GCM10025321 TaxID=3252684 RepID=UPI0036231756
MSEPTPDRDSSRPAVDIDTEALDTATGARGSVYALAARALSDPDPELYAALADGSIDSAVASLVDQAGLDIEAPDLTVEDDRDTLAARYNDLFVVGYSEVIDGTDGTIDSQGPPVSLYESTYRSDVSWNDVNLDLARAYEFFGCEIGGEERRHHDHIRLELEFVGYLCRVAAANDAIGKRGDDPNVNRARLDFHDRHLTILVSGLRERIDDEPGTGFYGRFARFLDEFITADVEDLATRLDVGAGSEREHVQQTGSNAGGNS